MDAIETIMTRRSVRQFSDRPISEEDLSTILQAAMSGPSCVNARDWSFLVTRDVSVLEAMARANGRPAEPLKKAALGILVLGDVSRSFPPAPDYWIIDGAIAAQNMVLAAHALGIGSVWLGTYPQMDRVDNLRTYFQLPEHVIPHSIIAFGYPQQPIPAEREARYEPDRVHYDRW